MRTPHPLAPRCESHGDDDKALHADLADVASINKVCLKRRLLVSGSGVLAKCDVFLLRLLTLLHLFLCTFGDYFLSCFDERGGVIGIGSNLFSWTIFVFLVMLVFLLNFHVTTCRSCLLSFRGHGFNLKWLL